MLEIILYVLLFGFAGIGLFVTAFLGFALFMHWFSTREFRREQD